METKDSKTTSNNATPDVSGSSLPQKHQLEYSIFSCKISWCPICKEHFYTKQNEVHRLTPTPDDYHILNCH